MKTLLPLFVVLLTLGLPNAAFCQPFRVGPELQINTYTSDSQRVPSVTAGGSGSFVVVWSSAGSEGSDSSNSSVQGQRFDSAGAPAGTEFQINTYTIGDQSESSVAADASDSFVVVWASAGSSGSDSSINSIQGQRFDAAGAALGTEFQINTYTTQAQLSPSVAIDGSASFVVVWTSTGSSGSDSSAISIQGQRFDSAGAFLGTEFQVNTYTTLDQRNPDVAADAMGRFVVVWQSRYSSGSESDFSVQGQRFDSAGMPVGTEFKINTYTSESQGSPRIAADASGSFVVVWDSRYSPTSEPYGGSVRGQRFDSAGTPVGTEFQISTTDPGFSMYPTAAADASGSFVVVWASEDSGGTDSSDKSIQAQRFTVTELCGAVPELDSACHLAAANGAGKSLVQVRDATPDRRDKFTWKWSKGTAVAAGDFKMPDVGGSTYRLCIYDADGMLKAMNLQPGGNGETCNNKPCWQKTGKGFRYKSRTGSASDGMTRVKFDEGDIGKSKIRITAKGNRGYFKAPAPLVLTEPVVVQLLIDDGIATECFKTTFSSVIKKDLENYKAKGP